MEGISIIICCFNSAKRLPSVLKHIANQRFINPIPCEIILVNNNSTDDTIGIAKIEWEKLACKFPFLIINETKQGLSFARKKGVDNAKYEFLIFCDDDNWLSHDYVELAYRFLNEDPRIGVLGGQGDYVCEVSPPGWFLENMTSYAIGKQAQNSGDITEKGFVWGAGMVLRKNIFLKSWEIRFRTFLTGRNGNLLSAGDDTEICKWAILLGYRLWYNEGLKFTHYVPKERLTKDYFEAMWNGFRSAAYWHDKYNTLILIKCLKNSYKRNLYIALKLLIRKSNRSTTYKQFLLGPIWRISSKDDFRFIKIFFKVLYSS